MIALVSFKEALLHAKERTIKEDYMAYYKDEQSSITTFTDGTALIAQSEYDGPYSEDTDGNGIEQPTFYLAQSGDDVPANCHYW